MKLQKRVKSKIMQKQFTAYFAIKGGIQTTEKAHTA